MISAERLTRRGAEAFLYREARLLDEGRIEEWLELFTEDGRYWIPENRDDADPTREVSIIYDDRQRLEERVYRLRHTPVHGQTPPSRTRHFISNVQVEGEEEGAVTVYANFIVYEVRLKEQRSLAGQSQYRLRRVDGDWRIVLKKVNLINNDCPIFNLTFII